MGRIWKEYVKDQLRGVFRVIMSTGLLHKHPRPFQVERDPCAYGTHNCMAAPGVLVAESAHTGVPPLVLT